MRDDFLGSYTSGYVGYPESPERTQPESRCDPTDMHAYSGSDGTVEHTCVDLTSPTETSALHTTAMAMTAAAAVGEEADASPTDLRHAPLLLTTTE